MLITVLILLLGAFTSAYAAPPCCGADLTGCGPIARPDPRCDPMTCDWGSVSHTYSCPDERTCDMDCFGCNIATLTWTCSVSLATWSCDPEPTNVSTCSKTAGVGIIFFQYMCEDPDHSAQTTRLYCHELCCCEQIPNGGVGISDAIHCTSPGVFNKGFGDGAAQDKRAYCPGYEIPEWN